MKGSQYNIIPHDYTIWLLYEINVRLPLVMGLLYQRELVPVSAFRDVRSAFLAFLGKKLLAGMAS
jgi:hypothetical protein